MFNDRPLSGRFSAQTEPLTASRLRLTIHSPIPRWGLDSAGTSGPAAAGGAGADRYFGMNTVPLGQAVLNPTESHGNLTVSNIGSSGKDGVETLPGPSDGLVHLIDHRLLRPEFVEFCR